MIGYSAIDQLSDILGIVFLAFIIFSFRFSWWRKDISYSYPRVLMYHMVSEHLEKDKSKFNRLFPKYKTILRIEP